METPLMSIEKKGCNPRKDGLQPFIPYYYIFISGSLLQLSQFYNLVNCSAQAVLVLTASLSIVRLTATAALNQLGSFANHLTGVQTVILHHVVAEHYAEHWLVVIY